MINLSREDRTASMEAVITDVLHHPDFNPLAVSVERPRRPEVGTDGETYWREVGLCRVVIEGAIPIDDTMMIHFAGPSEDVDDEDLQFADDQVEETDGAIHSG